MSNQQAEVRNGYALIEISKIKPSPWNPNRMDGKKFAEYVAEVKHLGRLPKPTVVRPNCEGFEIIDGEHGWRAAQEIGLKEIDCEIVSADDFEAMRQTYKRNQSGKHNKVLQGRMFRQMLEARDLSQRQLAKEIQVSEGTVRNSLLYAEAVERREVYLVEKAERRKALGYKTRKNPPTAEEELEKLTARQVRCFMKLPSMLGNMWLDSGSEQYGIDVVMVDPVYRGLRGLDARQMAEIGDAIISFAQSCQPAAVMFAHHVVKMAARDGGVPTLEDLTGAGFAESCGNWWLIGRNQPYKFDLQHDLTVVYGGRDEQSGLKRIKFDEDLWQFEISSGEDLQESKERERQQQKNESHQAKVEAAKEEVKNCLRGEKQPRPKRWVEDRSTAGQKFTRIAVAELLRDGELAEEDYKDSRTVTHTGIKLTDSKPF